MNSISLISALENYIKVEDYFDIILQLLDSLESMQREDMKILLDLSSMSLKDGRLQFSIQREDSVYELSRIKEFLKDLTFACVFSPQEQCAVVTQFLKLVDTVAEVNFYAVIRQYCEERLGITAQAQPAAAPQPAYEPQQYYPESANGETGVLSDSFWKNLENQYQSQYADNGASYAQQQGGRYAAFSANGETGVLDPSFWQQISQGGAVTQGRTMTQQSPRTGSLIDARTGYAYAINKDNFWIGKGDVDLQIDKDTVSRKHAQIIVKQNHYFLVDNGSTNKTYVEGKEIPPKASIELYNGNRIKFANEEFVFQI